MAAPKKSAKSDMPMPDGLFPVNDGKHVAMKGTYSSYSNMPAPNNMPKPPQAPPMMNSAT